MSGMATSSIPVRGAIPRGSVKDFLDARRLLAQRGLSEARKRSAVGFDVATETCQVLPDIVPLPIAQWQEGSELYNMIYDVLGKNEILRKKSGKKKTTHVSKWTAKFTKFAATWKDLLKGTAAEILSKILSELIFYELPCGSMPVEEWCKAHVPSVLCLLYRGLPGDKRHYQGEEALLKSWKRHIQVALKGAAAENQGSEHRHPSIRNFDEFTSTRWILQPEDKYEEEGRRVDVVRVVHEVRRLLLRHELYLNALQDLHAGLMADLAGRWYCDYYVLPGPSGYFTGNDIGRYVADILNPFHLLSPQHQQSFIHNGLQHRRKYQHVYDPQNFFEACMAEPATDVACESVFSMLYIIMLESKDKDRWHECCQIIERDTLCPQALQQIPPEHAGKVLVRMKDPVLERWFSACKVISETVAQVKRELNTETPTETPCRKDVFPRLLWHLGFGEDESEELC